MLPPGFVCAGKVAILATNTKRVSLSTPKSRTAHVHQRPRTAPVLDLSSHGHECLLNIRRILCTCLQERNANLICESLRNRSAACHACTIGTAWPNHPAMDVHADEQGA